MATETSPPRLAVKAKPYQRRVLDLPPCLVCGGKGSGIHYGVNTCQGCKVFFQRSLKRTESFVCKHSGSCKIIDSNRGNCPACRMEKCLAVGMSRDGIRMGRYTLTERTLKIKEVNKLKAAKTTGSDVKNGSGSCAPGTESNAQIFNDKGSDFSSPLSDSSQSSSLWESSPETLRFREHFSEPEGSVESSDDLHQHQSSLSESSSPAGSSDGQKEKMCLFAEVLQQRLSVRNKKSPEPAENKDSVGNTGISNTESEMSMITRTTDVDTASNSSCLTSGRKSHDHDQNGAGSHINHTQASCDDTSAKQGSFNAESPLSAEETKFLDKITNAFRTVTVEPDLSAEEIRAKLTEAYVTHQYKVQLFGPMKALSMEEYKHVRKETGLDVDGRIALINEWTARERGYIELYVDFAHTIPGFADLPFRDQVSLLKASIFDFDAVVNSRGVEADLEMIYLPYGGIYHLDQVCMFDTLEICKGYCEICKRYQQMDLTFQELALTTCIGLTFRDRCRLQNPVQVENIQLDMVSLLQKLLNQRHEDLNKGRKLFIQIMDLFVRMREISENSLKNWKELSKDEFVREVIPSVDTYIYVE